MSRTSLEDIEPQYEPDWSDKVEPYTSAIAMGADALGLGLSFGGPIAATIGAGAAILGNIPNIIIDGYQTYRDWRRTIQDGAPVTNALYNTGETALDFLGAKWASKGVKFINDRQFAKEVKGLIQDEVKRREGRRILLRKRGMTDKEITKYIGIKATNAVVNSKNVVKKRKEVNKRSKVVGKRAGYVIGLPNNIYHSRELIAPQDNTTFKYKQIN